MIGSLHSTPHRSNGTVLTVEESPACRLEPLDAGRYRDLLVARADAVHL